MCIQIVRHVSAAAAATAKLLQSCPTLCNPIDGSLPGSSVPEILQARTLEMTKRLHFDFSLSCTRGRNGNPLQCSCLENPRGGGAWWAAVSEVAQSRTRLKRLSSGSSERGLLFVVVSGFFIGVASLCRTGSMPCWLQ